MQHQHERRWSGGGARPAAGSRRSGGAAGGGADTLSDAADPARGRARPVAALPTSSRSESRSEQRSSWAAVVGSARRWRTLRSGQTASSRLRSKAGSTSAGGWKQRARETRPRSDSKAEYEGLAQFLEMSKITMTIFYVAHFVACFWYLVGDGSADIVGYTTADSHCSDTGTDCLPAGVPLYETFEGAGADSENGGSVLHGWVQQHGWHLDKNNPSLWTRYLDCFYFSVTTLTT